MARLFVLYVGQWANGPTPISATHRTVSRFFRNGTTVSAFDFVDALVFCRFRQNMNCTIWA